MPALRGPGMRPGLIGGVSLVRPWVRDALRAATSRVRRRELAADIVLGLVWLWRCGRSVGQPGYRWRTDEPGAPSADDPCDHDLGAGHHKRRPPRLEPSLAAMPVS